MTEKWIVIGICGTTCSGKTTLANELKAALPENKVRIIGQDDYELPTEDPRVVWVPELNHPNFELITNLDMDKMYADIEEVLKDRYSMKLTNGKAFDKYLSVAAVKKVAFEIVNQTNANVLIIEGFCIFSHKHIEHICDLKYYLTINESECKRRRAIKNEGYDYPDCPGYFEMCIWPQHLANLKEAKDNVKNVTYFDENSKDLAKTILMDIVDILN